MTNDNQSVPFFNDFTLSHDEFKLIRNYIYNQTGIFFNDERISFVSKRVFNRMLANNMDSFIEYYNYIKYRNKDEFDEMVECLTINETYFYRDIPQLDSFSQLVLPEILIRKAKNGNFYFRIWSAGCSTGEEPYTIAIILKERIKYFEDWNIEIVATDINRKVLKHGKSGVYSKRSLMDTPDHIKKRYFKYDYKSETYILNDAIKRMVQFSRLNLFDSINMLMMKNFDIVFCRNVLIYFDEQSSRKVIHDFYESINPGGYIFLGHSESVNRISKDFELVRMGSDIVYRKPFK